MQKPAMEKLLDAVFVKLAESNPTTPLTTERKNRIEQRLLQLIPDLHTPSHPPYASMIHSAIVELNQKRGSSEESISMFIKKKYDDLPWAHASYLSHHLEKLCQKGEILVTRNKCYKLNLNPKVAVKKRKRGRGRHGKETFVEEESQSHKQQSTVDEENRPKNQQIRLRIVRNKKEETKVAKDQGQSRWTRIELIEEQEQSHDRHGEMVEEKSQQWGELVVLEEQNRPMGPQNELTEEQNQSREQQHEAVIEQNQGDEKHTELNEEQDETQGQQSFVSARQEHPEKHHIVVIEERNQAEEKNKENEGLEELEDPKSRVNNETELVGQHRSETHPSIHGDNCGSGDGDRVSSMFQFGEPLEPLNKVVEEQFPPQGENMRSGTDILRPCHDGKAGNSDGNHTKAPANVTAKPVMEEDKQNKLEEKQPDKKILSEGKMEVVCALQALKKQHAKFFKQVKPPPLQPGSTPATCDLLINQKQLVEDHNLLLNPKRPPGFECPTLQKSFRRRCKQAKHCGVQLSESQAALTETPLEPTAVQHLSQIQQERQQPRKLRQRGDKMSDPKPATITSVEEILPIQHEHQLFLPSNLEGCMEIKPTSMEETSQSTEQQPKTRGQRKQLTSQPQGSSLAPQQSELPLQQEPSNEESPLELERNKAEKSIETVVQQRQENLQRRKLRPRGQEPPKPEAAAETVMEQALPSQYQVPGRRRGRNPKLIKATITVHDELLPSQQKEYDHEPKQKQRGRGRPPKAKLDAGTTKGDDLQSGKRKRGRPPKYKPTGEADA